MRDFKDKGFVEADPNRFHQYQHVLEWVKGHSKEKYTWEEVLRLLLDDSYTEFLHNKADEYLKNIKGEDLEEEDL